MTHLHLSILRTDQTCRFRLRWGEGQQIQAKLPLLATLLPRYQDWQQCYLKFYRSLPLDGNLRDSEALADEIVDEPLSNSPTSLRARVGSTGTFQTPATDWRVRLAQAETDLLNEFYHWLADAELLKLRQTIVQCAVESSAQQPPMLFLDCDDPELARLPWESWELGMEAIAGPIQIVRTATNRRSPALQPRRRGKMRMLVILGAANELSFASEKQALTGLHRDVEIEWLDCFHLSSGGVDVKAEICRALTDPKGWDILFFGGHSNESNRTGGELSLSPETAILIKEIESELQTAKQRGLKFALFNSCKGLSIAHALINLGLGNVAVMREPVHNAVAEAFLVAFIQALARQENVHQALHSACEFFKLRRGMAYPSAGLIPSLFCHPEATPFRLERYGWRQQLSRWRPKKPEAIALSLISLLSLMEPVQTPLLDLRTGAQAFYRHRTARAESQAAAPTLLLQIDEDSLDQAGVVATKRNPIERSYLAEVLQRAQALDAAVIGVDYVLEDATVEADDEAIAAAIEQTAAQSTLVFASQKQSGGGETEIHADLVGRQPIQQGYLDWFYGYMAMPRTAADCQQQCSFSRVVAQAFAASQVEGQVTELKSVHLSAIARWAGQRHQPAWLHPVWDLSIPPNQVYDAVTDAELVERALLPLSEQQPFSSSPIVLVVPGGYGEAGVDGRGFDNYSLPLAFEYWQSVGRDASRVPDTFTGAEAHAYMIHHWLNQHFVWSVPVLWFILLAGLLAKWRNLFQKEKPKNYQSIAAYFIYGWICLEAYISLGLMLPFFLPAFTFYWLTKTSADGVELSENRRRFS